MSSTVRTFVWRAALLFSVCFSAQLSQSVAAQEPLPECVAAQDVVDPFARLRGGHVGPNGEHWRLVGKGLATLGSLDGAVYDPESGVLVLCGPPAKGVGPYHLDELMVVLRARYFESASPGMTIEPDPKDQNGPLQSVQYFGGTENTALGWLMFEADRLLKSYSAGRDNLTGLDLKTDIDGFNNMTVLRAHFREFEVAHGNRFWLTLDPKNGSGWDKAPERSNGYQPLLALSADSQAMYFEHHRLYLGTQVMKNDAGKLVPAVAQESKAATQFANHFDKHASDFGKLEPVLERLQAISRLIPLADWIHHCNVPLDLEYVRQYQPRIAVITPRTTPTIESHPAIVRKSGNPADPHSITTTGGVDLRFTGYPVKDERNRAKSLQRLVHRELAKHSSDVAFTVETNAGPMRLVVVPTFATRFANTTTSTALAARLAAPESKPASPKEDPTAHLPPRELLAEPERAALVPRPMVGLQALDYLRQKKPEPPESDAPEAIIVDTRHWSDSERAQLVSAERQSLASLISHSHQARGPPETKSGDPDAVTVAPPPLPGEERNAPVARAREPLTVLEPKQESLPRGPPAPLAGSERSEITGRDTTPLTSLDSSSTITSQQSGARLALAAPQPTASAGRSLGLPLFQDARGRPTFALPRIAHFDDPKTHWTSAPDSALPDALVLVSDAGDVYVPFEMKQRTSIRGEEFVPAMSPVPGLIGYSPSRRTLAFDDGYQLRFDESGFLVEARLTDGQVLQFSYVSQTDSAKPRTVATCTLAASNAALRTFRLATTSADVPARPMKSVPAPVVAEVAKPAEPMKVAAPVAADPPPAATVTAPPVIAPAVIAPPAQVTRPSRPSVFGVQQRDVTKTWNVGDTLVLPITKLPSPSGRTTWQALMRPHNPAGEEPLAPTTHVEFASPSGQTLQASLQRQRGTIEAGASADLNIVVTCTSEAADGLPPRADLWIDVVQEFDGAPAPVNASIPVLLTPGRHVDSSESVVIFTIGFTVLTVMGATMWRLAR